MLLLLGQWEVVQVVCVQRREGGARLLVMLRVRRPLRDVGGRRAVIGLVGDGGGVLELRGHVGSRAGHRRRLTIKALPRARLRPRAVVVGHGIRRRVAAGWGNGNRVRLDC